MNAPRLWAARALGGETADEFREHGYVGVGFGLTADLSRTTNIEEIEEAWRGAHLGEVRGSGTGGAIPLHAGGGGTGSPAFGPGTARPGRRRFRILTANDDLKTLRYLHAVLAKADCESVVTGDPEAVRMLIAERQPHLVLLDLMLPGTDGVELMREILTTPDVPAIFLSRCGQDETVALARDMGTSDCVVKLFFLTELPARIRAAIRKRFEPEHNEPSAFCAAGEAQIGCARSRATLEGNR